MFLQRLITGLVLGLLCAAAPAMAQCPKGMVAVDGQFCIDQYEYPNIKGSKPLTDVSWDYASTQCDSAGKRLCHADEWKKACGGPQGYAYPYGAAYAEGVCDSGDARKAYSGDRERCASGFGVYDMAANVAEWLADGRPGTTRAATAGGSYEAPAGASCDAIADLPADKEDPAVGFRCCADLGASPAKPAAAGEPAADEPKPAAPQKRTASPRARKAAEEEPIVSVFSPITRHPSPDTRLGGYFITQFYSLGNIMDAPAINTQVSGSAYTFTAGFKFENNATLEITRASHKIEEARSGIWTPRRDADFIFNVSYALTSLLTVDNEWPGGILLGARRFDNHTGQVTEFYTTKEFKQNNLTITTGFNYLARTVGKNKFGLMLDLRYAIIPELELFGQYNTHDFYKSIVNDYLAADTTTARLAGCGSCRQHTASLGLNYGVLKQQGGLYFQMYDIGDLNVPMGGLYVNF